MTKCEEYRERLVDRHMNRLEADDAAELELHLNTCADCLKALAATGFVLDNINNLRDPEPSARVKADFRVMLDDFKAKEKKPVFRDSIWAWLLRPRLPLPYGLIIIVCIGVAYWLGRTNRQLQDAQELHARVHDPKQTMMLAMLGNTLASERIKAVNYTDEMKRVDKQVREALLATLNNDPNDNVRLSTLEALSRLADDSGVRIGLIRSITRQESPVVQIAIAEVMLKLQEKRSVAPLKELLKQQDLDSEVKYMVQKTITKLI